MVEVEARLALHIVVPALVEPIVLADDHLQLPLVSDFLFPSALQLEIRANLLARARQLYRCQLALIVFLEGGRKLLHKRRVGV